MNAYDWLSEVMLLETRTPMTEAALDRERNRLGALMESLSEEDQDTAELIYSFWLSDVTDGIAEA